MNDKTLNNSFARFLASSNLISVAFRYLLSYDIYFRLSQSFYQENNNAQITLKHLSPNISNGKGTTLAQSLSDCTFDTSSDSYLFLLYL